MAPGTHGLINALSPMYCNWAGIVDIDPKPPVLWTRGSADLVVADGSPLEMGTLGAAGTVPNWPGTDVFGPQPMVSQTGDVLQRYGEAGGSVRTEVFEGVGHSPHLEAPEAWMAVFTEFLAATERR